MSDIETAGLVDAMERLKQEHGKVLSRIENETDPAEIASLSAEAGRIEAEFDALTRAMHSSASEKGRALNAQKLTIDQDFTLVSVKTRAKAAKGKALTEAESAQLAEMTKQLEEARKKIGELEAQMAEQAARVALRRARTRGPNRPKQDLDAELDQLLTQTRTLLKAGCKET